jgi:arsenate reductase
MYPTIHEFIKNIEVASIPKERKVILDSLVSFLQKEMMLHKTINLTFICTHNSRRSHLGQIWAKTMATYFGLNHIHTYSGGTEATAIYKSVLNSLRSTGFELMQLSQEINPIVALKIGDVLPPIIAFSKKYDHDFNPQHDFIAIMTCDNADESCPIIEGAKARFAIKYIDPKVSDGTAEEALTYNKRSLQIAQEMKYVFSILGGE